MYTLVYNIYDYSALENIDGHSCTVNSHHVETALCTIDDLYHLCVHGLV